VDLSELLDAVRRHKRIVIGMVVLAALVAALYVVFRRETRTPDTFRAVADVQIPAQPSTVPKAPQPASEAPPGMPKKLLRRQDSLARSAAVQGQALSNSDVPINDTSVILDAALNDTRDTITLSVRSNTAETTDKVLGNYVAAFADAREAVAAQEIQSTQQSAQEQLQALQSRRSAIESQLRQRLPVLPPVVRGPSQPSESGGSASRQEQEPVVPEVPSGADSDTTLMLFERNALANRIEELQLAYADAGVNSSVPNSYTEVLDQRTASLIPGETQSPIVPVGIIMLVGLALGLAGAVLIDRGDHTIRSVKAASATLSAPLLSTAPPPRRGKPEYAVLERPDSVRSAAFRKLAATCIATDRLPQAIMVSTPEGDTHDYVAANFAAALADLGLQVALVATSPRQSWYLEQFTVPIEGEGDLSQLLEHAHEGRFNGEATRHLAWTDLTANLVVVPPSPEGALTVPLDGIPPFLESLERSGIDVTVIAGPALLEDANATIVAWETRSVLWAVQVGTVTRRAASEAAARLELANVNPFGVVMVGAPEA
jgi:Mrp family chromosome partitioning ATPase